MPERAGLLRGVDDPVVEKSEVDICKPERPRLKTEDNRSVHTQDRTAIGGPECRRSEAGIIAPDQQSDLVNTAAPG